MKIKAIKFHNFRVYGGDTKIIFNNKKDKNISLIAGKNGFGKTTFLTSLIWVFYGKLMSQVEDKYKEDIKKAGGYEKYVLSLFNKTAIGKLLKDKSFDNKLNVEIQLEDVLIPSIPCKNVTIKREYDYSNKKETLEILIDGHENELTKKVGYDIFINDFILPREIAKFFFFDAEKIVTLAEAKSKDELRSLSKAYSEVLGIKKYEDLKYSLNTILTKLRRGGISKVNKDKLDELIKIEKNLKGLIHNNRTNLNEKEESIKLFQDKSDQIQEQLIRAGNEVTLVELKLMKDKRKALKEKHTSAKNELKKLYDFIPFAIAKDNLKELVDQINLEIVLKNSSSGHKIIKDEIEEYANILINKINSFELKKNLKEELFAIILNTKDEKLSQNKLVSGDILLDISDEIGRKIIANYEYLNLSFKNQLSTIVKEEKEIRFNLNKILNKIKMAEARKDNPLAKELRLKKSEIDNEISLLKNDINSIAEEYGKLRHQLDSNKKVLSEYEKNFKLTEIDQKKYTTTEELLEKINKLIKRIKDEKKYSLQKAIVSELNKLMHKNDFISSVNVRLEEDIMDIDLLDSKSNVINKETLSKGEQQLYATALLKALVDESGINFPVFIDSPLQKFDVEHSGNVIKQFYPTISEQVVLFPLLEKELSKKEFEQLRPYLDGAYLIENSRGNSSITACKEEELFKKFEQQNYVFTN